MLLIKRTPPFSDSHPRALGVGWSLTLSSSAPPFIYICFSFSRRSPIPISRVLNEIMLNPWAILSCPR